VKTVPGGAPQPGEVERSIPGVFPFLDNPRGYPSVHLPIRLAAHDGSSTITWPGSGDTSPARS